MGNKRDQINYVEFPARDLSATKEFFKNCFGWSFTEPSRNELAVWSDKEAGDR